MPKLFRPLNTKGSAHYVVPIVVIVLVALVGARVLLSRSHALTSSTVNTSSCAPSGNLVNPCHPWIGAAVTGDPSAPASDKISQFNYLEKLLGTNLDIFHDYHPSGSVPLNSDETYFANRANTYDYINWKPGPNWKSAMAVNQGGSQSVNNDIKQAAENIKGLKHKVFLTVWHEPENDVSAFDNATQKNACTSSPHFTNLKGSAGTPDQYQAMWQNVRNIFDAQGVTNVVWVMNYMGYQNWDCLVPYMWPGNNLVDWVTMDSYAGSSQDWAGSVGRIYGVLEAASSNTVDLKSKPWGAAEFNDCNSSSDTDITHYFDSAKTALDTNAYPRLKMYMVYDDTGNNAGPGCLVDHLPSGAYDGTKLAAFKKFFTDPIFQKNTPPTGDKTPPTVSITSPANGATVSGVVVVGVKASDNVGVTESKLVYDGTNIIRDATSQNDYGWGSRWGSYKTSNGKHTLTVTAYDAAGNHSSYTITVNVKN